MSGIPTAESNHAKPTGFGTALGAGACVLWMFGALAACLIKDVPLFAFLAIAQGIGFLITASYLTIRRRWRSVVSQPLWFWILSVVCLTTNQLAYVAAFRLAPADQVDLINYMWPMILALVSCFLPGGRFSVNYLIGALLGFIGVAQLVLWDSESSLSAAHWPGWICAGVACVSWVIYCAACRIRRKTDPAMMGVVGGLSGLLIAVLAIVRGDSFTFTGVEWSAIVAWGALYYGLSLPMWNYGITRGRFRLLNLLSFSVPTGSVALLVLGGQVPASPALLMACVFVTLGSLWGCYGSAWSRALKKKLSDLLPDRALPQKA